MGITQLAEASKKAFGGGPLINANCATAVAAVSNREFFNAYLFTECSPSSPAFFLIPILPLFSFIRHSFNTWQSIAAEKVLWKTNNSEQFLAFFSLP
jgi:hypothetical protein